MQMNTEKRRAEWIIAAQNRPNRTYTATAASNC
jgi:hypothetical protein